MKNREKYPKTDDALKAFAEHNKHCPCGCTFEEWLDLDSDEVPFGLKFAALGLALLSGIKKDAERKSEPTGDEKKPDEAGDIECPICHGKHGEIKFGLTYPDFRCPDCKAIIANKDFGSYNSSLAEFKAWFVNRGKAARKD